MSVMKKIFEKQFLHLLALLFLIAGLFCSSFIDGFSRGHLWGINTLTWLYWLVGLSILHQVFVWLCWRTELYHLLLSKWFGQRAFDVYAVLFFLLIISRPIFITLLAISNRNSFIIPRAVTLILVLLLTLPSLYLMFSIAKYFGFKRAFGIDHFDTSYREKSLVKKGIFRFTNNAMYSFGFLVLWIPGVLFSSVTALLAALFSHLYIWVHYFCTEKPDMNFIYGEKGTA